MIRTNNRFVAFLRKFKYAFRGLAVAIKEEKSLIVDFIFSIIVIIMAIIIGLKTYEWAILIMVITLVIGMELINTAIENLVDTISFKYNIDASKIKDTAAATSLVFSLMAIVVGLIIFVPKFIQIIKG